MSLTKFCVLYQEKINESYVHLLLFIPILIDKYLLNVIEYNTEQRVAKNNQYFDLPREV